MAERRRGSWESDALDVGGAVLRLEQIDQEQRPDHWLWDRVMTCDVPRLTELFERTATPRELELFTESRGGG